MYRKKMSRSELVTRVVEDEVRLELTVRVLVVVRVVVPAELRLVLRQGRDEVVLAAEGLHVVAGPFEGVERVRHLDPAVLGATGEDELRLDADLEHVAALACPAPCSRFRIVRGQ